MEEQVKKLIDIIFINYKINNYDKIIHDEDNLFYTVYLKELRDFVIKDKDKLLFDVISFNYFPKHVFFDYEYNFNDTLDNLKKASVALLNILNT